MEGTNDFSLDLRCLGTSKENEDSLRSGYGKVFFDSSFSFSSTWVLLWIRLRRVAGPQRSFFLEPDSAVSFSGFWDQKPWGQEQAGLAGGLRPLHVPQSDPVSFQGPDSIEAREPFLSLLADPTSFLSGVWYQMPWGLGRSDRPGTKKVARLF